jgi:superfamily II RNA helicase
MIGVPEPGPFVPDPFQLTALELIIDYDVLVSAPTGSGKTWIATQTIHSYLAKGQRVWYASPLKALSNSIYNQFCHEFGPNVCGILTGDRKENPDAPIIVGTTEILRNQLYDAMHHAVSIRTDLVILDEAHYLSDPERGVVWEEVLIYLPSRVRLLLLSATITNADEVCEWLMTIRRALNRVVLAEGRPVPLEMLFFFPDGLIAPLGGKRGLSSKVKKFLSAGEGKKFGRPEKIDFGEIIKCLRKFNLLPAIFFLKSRADCDRALKTCNSVHGPNDLLAEDLKTFVKDYPHLVGHRQIRPLVESRVASHHGGQLPYWKVLVEKTMNRGYLDAIFSTSTVAAGVNFPARTVVLVQSDRFNGREFANLTATELHQMIGRAGRRGKDYIGFALVVPGSYQDPGLIYELKDSPPEPILSQIHINFSMTLNLLLSHTPVEVKGLVERSFASFQKKESEILYRRRYARMLKDLKKALPRAKCDILDPYEVLENIEKLSELRKKTVQYENVFNDAPCQACGHLNTCQGKARKSLRKQLREICSMSDQMTGTDGGLWLSFKRHLRFLKETGFVDDLDRLTSDGFWASKLRVDQPLLIAEAIRKGAFDHVLPEEMAGGLAPFVWDRTQDVDLRSRGGLDMTELENVFDRVNDQIKGIRKLKKRRGFSSPLILFWPAAALFMWAKGVSWEQILDAISVDEGDLASLVLRTADHLRQVVNLKETHPRLAAVAEEAIQLILREPVYLE